MFVFIRILWLVIVFAPLAVAVVKQGQEKLGDPRKSFIWAGGWAAATLALMFAVDLGVYLFIEHSWFSQLAAANRFWTEYAARLILGIGGGLVVFGLAALLLGRLRKTLGGSARRLHVAAVSLVVAVLVGFGLTSLWEEVLVYLNRVRGLDPDPGLGISRTFYLFSMPLLWGALGAVENLIFLLLLGGIFMALADQKYHALTGGDMSTLFPSIRKGQNFFRGLAAVFLLKIAAERIMEIFELPLRRNGVVFGAGWMDVNVHVPTLIIAAAIFVTAAIWVLLAGRGGKKAPAEISDQGASKESRNLPSTIETGNGSDRGEGESRAPARADGGGPGTQPPDTFSGWWRAHRKTVLGPLILVGTLVVVRGLVPAIVRPLVLKPNEITLEQQYLQHNIDLTRQAYGISDETISTQRYQVSREVSPELLERNESTLSNIRLWDPRALLDNLREQQEIRLYYRFNDVDIDRYQLKEGYTQLMLGVRELEQSALASESNTWVSRHLKYTHGYGVVAVPVHTVRSDGRPDLIVRNIPAEAQDPRLEVSQPRIYYGERTDNHVYVDTSQDEFDYPQGDDNQYNSYDGAGGVAIGGFLRRLIYASRFDGAQQLFSSYIQPESRILFRRTLDERVAALAPFLKYDEDPYPVVTDDGRVKYILDAYTVATTYPYSERYAGTIGRFRGANYIRNSVKVVIDAYDGTVDFYVIDDDDPVLATYQSVFPGLFKPFSQMDQTLQRHIRYPIDLMTIQAEMYRTYHMTQPDTFYQREDLWEFATERYREDFQSVEPYYALLNLPDRDGAEFVGMLPFTPANKNVINAWMAARSDSPNYGELTVFTFPKGVEVLGPRQIEARIDQNTEMSRSLSLWGQRGSEVIRGNLLAVPLFDETELVILYAEPIFLQAENANLPEIKRVALADQSDVVWAPTFDEALREIAGLKPRTPDAAGPAGTGAGATDRVGVSTGAGTASGTGVAGIDGATTSGAEAAPEATSAAQAPGAGEPPMTRQQLQQATDAFNRFREALGAGNYDDAGEALDELGNILGQGESQ